MTEPNQGLAWTVDGMKERFRTLQSIADASSADENPLTSVSFCELEGSNERGPWRLRVHVSRSFIRAVKKDRKTVVPLLWKALLNLRYGYDPESANSPGGRDGIFHVTRGVRNAMVRKLYDNFLDTARGLHELGEYCRKPAVAKGVRVVSHGMRLLGFVERQESERPEFLIVLVDVDVNMRS